MANLPRLLLVSCMIILLASGCTKNDKGKSSEPSVPGSQSDRGSAKEQPPRPSPKADIAISAEELAKEYVKDKAAADKKYNGKILEVAGAYGGNGVGTRNDVYLIMPGYKDPMTSNFLRVGGKMTPAAGDPVRHLSLEQKIKVKGKCLGVAGDIKIDVQLADCELVETGPDTSTAITAVQLTREFSENQNAAYKKYDGKQLVIEGVVCDQDRPGKSTLKLQGFNEKAAKPIRVSVGSSRYSDQLTPLKIGDKVKLKASVVLFSSNEVIVGHALLVK